MTIGCYVRVSTSEQHLDRQLTSTNEYAQDELGADLSKIETYRDKSTGTDTERTGYRELMADIDAGKIEAVVVHDTTRLARSLQDLDRTVKRHGGGTAVRPGHPPPVHRRGRSDGPTDAPDARSLRRVGGPCQADQDPRGDRRPERGR